MPEFMKLMEDWKGYVALSDVKRPEGYERRLAEAIDLINNTGGLPAHRHEYLLREALTTSDFPYLFGDAIDRQILARYREAPSEWRSFVRMGTVPRIWPEVGGRRFAIAGGDQVLAEVPEKGEYQASERTEHMYDMYVKKYGRQFDISWESLINDDQGALQDTPQRFASAAVRTECRLVSGTYVSDLVGAANLYAAANANSGVLPLTIANLEATVAAMVAFTDANGEPIANRPRYLVVGPALEFTARQILTSATKMWVELGGAGGPLPYPMSNVISQYGLQLVIDPYIPIFAPAAIRSWFLFANPSDIAAMEFDYLRGHETPEICMKASDKVSIGGGAISPMEGDFATDNVFYRVRLVAGCNRLDWRATYGQLSNV